MRALKLSILTHSLNGGAFTNICPALMRGFQELGVDCELVLLHATAEELARYPDLRIVSLNVKRTSFSLWATVRYLREHQPDIMISMPWYFNIVAIWAKYLSGAKTKVIIGEQNIISLEASIEHRDKLHLRFLPILMRYTYPYGDGLVGVANDVITDLVEELNIDVKIPAQVIFNPSNPPRLAKLAQESIDHPWFQNSDIPVIVTAARLAKQKQLDNLLRAFARVVEETPARLIILGEGPLRAELEHLCQELGIAELVWMPGYDPNPYRYMARCDLFVLASAWEGSPVALQEAMACGAAALVTDAPGGMKDIVEYGKYGIMVPTNDTEALAQGILQILTQPELKERFRQQSKLRSQEFNYLNISKQYLEFCQSILSPAQPEVLNHY
jgi:glycosyltransferase involved in cell wall biosynthesis